MSETGGETPNANPKPEANPESKGEDHHPAVAGTSKDQNQTLIPQTEAIDAQKLSIARRLLGGLKSSASKAAETFALKETKVPVEEINTRRVADAVSRLSSLNPDNPFFSRSVEAEFGYVGLDPENEISTAIRRELYKLADMGMLETKPYEDNKGNQIVGYRVGKDIVDGLYNFAKSDPDTK